jgi:tRNA-dihydrouridine synthase B
VHKLGIAFPYMIAPMVGISHVAFRQLIRAYTPESIDALRFTEMLSTRKLPSEKLHLTRELRVSEGERFFIPQLLGNEEKFIGPSVKKLLQLAPWGFDINMGCPQSHILRHNWGVRLMGDAAYAADVVRMVKRHTDIPVSVKLRGGADKDIDRGYLLDFTSALEDSGVDWLTVHARPRAAKHEGPANWGVVGEVAQARKIPVVANGDIQTSADAIKIVKEYGCAGAMIAKAATARPWILWQIAEDLGIEGTPAGREGERAPRTPEEEGREFHRSFLMLIDLVERYFGEGDGVEDYGMQKLRFYAALGAKWFLFGHSFWRVTTKAKSFQEMREGVAHYAATYTQEMYYRID